MIRRVASLVVAAGLAAVATSCSSVDRKTQVTIALSSETQIPKELDSFAVRVFSTRSGELRFSQDYYPTSGREFPTTLAVIPFDESSLDSPLRIELEGRLGGATFLKRQAVLSYVKERNILLEMPLRMACFQFKDCGPTQTCAGGQCVASTVDSASLVDFDAKLVFPQGNVSIRWAAAPQRILALEGSDAQEGWTRTAVDRGQLSQGACDSHFQRTGPDGNPLVADWAKNVYVSSSCPTKTVKQPYCQSPTTQHSGIGINAPLAAMPFGWGSRLWERVLGERARSGRGEPGPRTAFPVPRFLRPARARSPLPEHAPRAPTMSYLPSCESTHWRTNPCSTVTSSWWCSTNDGPRAFITRGS
jgi:hypothetical protein